MSASKRDPVCGMPGVIERAGVWFCGERCAAEFARRHAAAEGASCRRVTVGRWGDPWVWVPLTALLLVCLGSWPPAASVSAIYQHYLLKVMVPLLLGVLIGGCADHFIPKEYIVTLLAGQRKRVIVCATLLGFLASSCSHGCLALSLELYRKGASIPAVVSFLLARPWASMAFTLMILSLFGVKGAAVVGGAFAIAFVTGLIFQRLAQRNLVESNPHAIEVREDFSIRQDLAARWRRYRWSTSQLARDAKGVATGMVPLGRMVLGWVQLGLVMSALLGALIPHEAFMRFFGPSVGGLFLTLLAATVIEVCSEGTAPLAFELFRQTGALGNAFAFLMGGVVTDYTELAAFWANIGRRTVLWMLAITLPQVYAVGWLLNAWK